jgi:hypothetical protein
MRLCVESLSKSDCSAAALFCPTSIAHVSCKPDGGAPETLPAFDSFVGVIVNHISDRAIQFDLDVKPLARFPHASAPADTYIALCRRPVRPQRCEPSHDNGYTFRCQFRGLPILDPTEGKGARCRRDQHQSKNS